MNDHQPESIEALRLKCMLLEVSNMGLRASLKAKDEEILALEKAHQHFFEHISNPRNYKAWLKNQLVNEPQVIKVA